MTLRQSAVLVLAWIALALPAPASTRYMPAAEVQTGMIGVGRTVFKGEDIEDFQATILGVIRSNIGPQRTTRPMIDPPVEIMQALATCDVGILCVHPREDELHTRMRIVAAVEQRQIRYAHMVGVTPAIMQQGMRADYRLVDRLSERVRERMRTARRLEVRTAAGTEIAATFDPSLAWVKTSGLINPRYWSNLPAGEVFTTPASVDGTFVCDGTGGDYFNAKYGTLDGTPLVLELRGGRLVSARCDNADLERDFWSYCHTDDNSDRVGELAFGTNLGLRAGFGLGHAHRYGLPEFSIGTAGNYRSASTSSTATISATATQQVGIDEKP